MTLEVRDVAPSPNVLRRKYRSPYAYKKLREAWEWALVCAVGPHHRELLRTQAKKGKVRVQITVHHTRAYDEDNLQGSQKPVLDALVNIGFLRGDAPDHLDLLPAVQVKCGREFVRTVVKIGSKNIA